MLYHHYLPYTYAFFVAYLDTLRVPFHLLSYALTAHAWQSRDWSAALRCLTDCLKFMKLLLKKTLVFCVKLLLIQTFRFMCKSSTFRHCCGHFYAISNGWELKICKYLLVNDPRFQKRYCFLRFLKPSPFVFLVTAACRQTCEWRNYADRRKPKHWERNLSQCQFFQRKTHVDWSRIEPWFMQWEAGE